MKAAHTLSSLAAASAIMATSALAGLEDPVRLDNLKPKKLEGPEFADVDGDGKKDLLSGVYSGALVYRKNVGTPKDPKFEAAVPLQAGGKDIKIKHW